MSKTADDICERYDTMSPRQQLLIYRHVLRRPPKGVDAVQSAIDTWLALTEDETVAFNEKCMSTLEDIENLS